MRTQRYNLSNKKFLYRHKISTINKKQQQQQQKTTTKTTLLEKQFKKRPIADDVLIREAMILVSRTL